MSNLKQLKDKFRLWWLLNGLNIKETTHNDLEDIYDVSACPNCRYYIKKKCIINKDTGERLVAELGTEDVKIIKMRRMMGDTWPKSIGNFWVCAEFINDRK